MNFHRLTELAAPSELIVTLELAKTHLRVVHDDEDDLITLLIEAATAFMEGPNGIGIALSPRQWCLSLDAFPTSIRIPLNPVQSITSVTYRDTGGQLQTLAPALYVVDTDGVATVERAPGAAWPSTSIQTGSVKVTFIAGRDTIPADLKAAALLIVGHLYENREAVVGATATVNPFELPLGVEAIFSRYRVLSFG